MKKIITSVVLILLLWMTSLSAFAQQVTKENAMTKASAFLNNMAAKNPSAARKAPRKTPRLVLSNNRDEFFVFNDEANGGYVVVSGDERMPDVLGYSADGRFDAENMPCNMKAWLEGYARQVDYLRSHPDVEATPRRAANRTAIAPLIKSKWSQFYPFNHKAPISNNVQCPTGCTATALAQIFYYHQWPKQTTMAIPAYTTSTMKIEMPEIPVTTIDWNNMRDEYPETPTPAEEDAVGNLMLLIGCTVGMDYWDEGSGGAVNVNAVRRIFDYYPFTRDYPGNYELEEWEQILYDELANGRPMFYEGYPHEDGSEGHAFVVDGCDSEGYFHINFGWGGDSDDYYLITEPKGYKLLQSAILGIQPLLPDMDRGYAVLDKGVLSFYFDNEEDTREGELFPFADLLPEDKAGITELVFNPSFAQYQMSNLSAAFMGMPDLEKVTGLEYLNAPKANSMFRMFSDCPRLKSVDMSRINVPMVKNMYGLFYNCSSLESVDLSGLNTSNVTDMGYMFTGCPSLKTLNLGHFDTRNVTNMEWMIAQCNALESVDVSHFDTRNVTNMYCMFFGNPSLRELDLSSFDTRNVTNTSWMFGSDASLTTVYVGDGWDMSKVANTDYMLVDCISLVGGMGTTYDSDILGSEYARVDGGAASPGYFTYKEATGISNTVVTRHAAADVYRLDGVRVRTADKGLEGLPRGIYVVNGKKVIVR